MLLSILSSLSFPHAAAPQGLCSLRAPDMGNRLVQGARQGRSVRRVLLLARVRASRTAQFRWPVTQHGNLNGWELAGQYEFLPFLGAVVDFNGNYGGVDRASTRVHTFLLGPQVSLPTKASPFAHALSLGTDTSLATAIGAGFDIKLVSFVKLRLIQVDYLRTQLHGATQNQARASADIVFHSDRPVPANLTNGSLGGKRRARPDEGHPGEVLRGTPRPVCYRCRSIRLP